MLAASSPHRKEPLLTRLTRVDKPNHLDLDLLLILIRFFVKVNSYVNQY